jgi:hypothetical protein
MAKTYTAGGTVLAGDVATAAAWNVLTVNSNNLIVPPAVSVFRSSTLSGYVSGAAITWQDEHYDTDSMWSSGAPTVITVGTTGLYAVHFQGQLTATATVNVAVPEIQRSAVRLMSGFASLVSGNESRFSLSGIVSLTAADSITATMTINGGSAYNIVGGATYGDTQARLSLTWVGRTA